jgi:hypothetical protein
MATKSDRRYIYLIVTATMSDGIMIEQCHVINDYHHYKFLQQSNITRVVGKRQNYAIKDYGCNLTYEDCKEIAIAWHSGGIESSLQWI